MVNATEDPVARRFGALRRTDMSGILERWTNSNWWSALKKRRPLGGSVCSLPVRRTGAFGKIFSLGVAVSRSMSSPLSTS